MSIPGSPKVIYSIGHSNRDTDAFLNLVRSIEARRLVDVRAYPRSRRHPQFERQRLRESLSEAGIVYHWAGALGGFRKASPNSLHQALKSPALRAYADHMHTNEFNAAITALMKQANDITTVIMCAEKEPENCHRSMIADYLTMRGVRVLHLIDAGHIVEHHIRAIARCQDERLIYDRMTQDTLRLNDV